MAPLGRAALLLAFGLVLYALIAGSYAAWKKRRRLAHSAQNALLIAFPVTLVARDRADRRARAPRHDLRLRLAAHEPQAAASLRALRLLGRPGGVAPALAARAHGLRGARGLAQPPLAGAHRVDGARLRARGRLLRLHALLRLEPVQRPAGAAGRPGDGAEPAEPVHAGPPAAALPRLRRAHRPVRVRDGRAPVGSHGRALDRRDAPLDARRVDVPRRRPAGRLPLGVRGDRLGRLLRLGPGRERGADAVARSDRVPAFGDDPGEARDAEGLEHDPRRARVQPVAVRHVPHALGRDRLDPLVRARARSAAGSSPSSC